MRSTQLGQRETIVAVFSTGDDVTSGLLGLARDQNITAASFFGVGALERVTLGYFDLGKKEYQHIPLDEQVEVMSLVGDLSVFEGEPKLHAHIVVGKRDGSACGGHLISATVRPTLEVFIQAMEGRLTRTTDAETGLALLDLDK